MTQMLKSEGANALLWRYQLDGKGGVTESASDVQSPLTWVHLRSDAPDSAQTMRDLGLSDSVLDALTATETRPRAVMTDAGIMLYLRGINKNPEADPEDMVSLRVWLTPNLVVTARRTDRRLLSVIDVKEALVQGDGPVDGGDLICALVERIAERIKETLDAIDDELTDLEQLLAQEASIDRLQLASLRRQATALRRYLAPQRDALDALFRHKSWLTEVQLFEIREQGDRMTRYVEDLDLARERALMLQEELRNQIAEKQNMRMYVLSLVTAVFLPLSFLTGVFGMNVAGLPGTEAPMAFVYLSCSMLLIALVVFALMRWKKWL